MSDVVPMKEKATELTDIPAVRDYLNRHGAEVTSLRRAVVREPTGNNYHRDVVVFSFDKANGKVTVRAGHGSEADPEDYKPSEDEQKRITDDWARFQLPRSVDVIHNATLPKALQEADPKDVFKFYDKTGKRLLFVHQRVEEDGGKRYIPWSHWDDGSWRMAEPDGGLPFWGMEQLKEHSIAFLHEGAKSAAYVRWMVEGETQEARDALACHPWGQELSHAAHLGWVGGASVPHATDWALLKDAGVTAAILVLDNDQGGKDALGPIARVMGSLGIKLYRIMFSEEFPPKFDLADPFPDAMFKRIKGKDVYTGPTYHDCCFPAVWATKKKGKMVLLRDEFAALWYHVQGLEKPIAVNAEDPTLRVSASAFNRMCAPFSEAQDTFSLLSKRPSSEVMGITFAPGSDGRTKYEGNRLKVNTWLPPKLPKLEDPDWSMLDEYFERLIPDEEDRHELKRFFATLIAHPEVRMGYGVILASTTQGTGKTTIYEIARRVLGWWNVSSPDENDVMSDYNEWIVDKTLAVIPEIYAGHNWKAYNKLKRMITDHDIIVNDKYVPKYTTRNHCHFILCSNSKVALRMEKSDRRYLVPRVSEKDTKGDPWWVEFYEWLDGEGPSAIKAWADDFGAWAEANGKKGYVSSHEKPPMNAAKRRMIEASQGEVERALEELLQDAKEVAQERGELVSVSLDELTAWVNASYDPPKGKKEWSTTQVSRVAVEQGWAGSYRKSNTVDGKQIKKRWLATTEDAEVYGFVDLQRLEIAPSAIREGEM